MSWLKASSRHSLNSARLVATSRYSSSNIKRGRKWPQSPNSRVWWLQEEVQRHCIWNIRRVGSGDRYFHRATFSKTVAIWQLSYEKAAGFCQGNMLQVYWKMFFCMRWTFLGCWQIALICSYPGKEENLCLFLLCSKFSASCWCGRSQLWNLFRVACSPSLVIQGLTGMLVRSQLLSCESLLQVVVRKINFL